MSAPSRHATNWLRVRNRSRTSEAWAKCSACSTLTPHGTGTRVVNRETFMGPIATEVIEGRETLTKELTNFREALKGAAET
jgi:hypothetical protein